MAVVVTPISTALAQVQNATVGQNATKLVDLNNITLRNAVIAFVISFGVVSLMTFVAYKLVHRKSFLIDIIKGDDGYPSLAIFQFLVWTFVILFAFAGLYIFRVMVGVTEPPTSFPETILALMGISVATPIISGGVSRTKYKGVTEEKDNSDEQGKDDKNRLSSMLEENGRPTLTRYQMFSWTWISILIFLVYVFANVSSGIKEISATFATSGKDVIPADTANKFLSIPNIDPALVVLMGMSQGAYIGGKLVARTPLTIYEILPPKAKKGMALPLQVIGSGFGDTSDTVWFGNKKYQGKDISLWTDVKIDLSISQQDVDAQTIGTVEVVVIRGSDTTRADFVIEN
jgi:hypothetical protein